MDQLPSLHNLSSSQKDILIVILWEENRALKERIKILEQENVVLKAQVADLMQKLNSNSQNSHRPPSSDGFKRVQLQTHLTH